MRAFDCEAWSFMPAGAIGEAREAARDRFEAAQGAPALRARVDIDPEALKLAERHVSQAGLAGRIKLEKCDVRDASAEGFGAIVDQSSLRERLGNARAAQAVARELGKLMQRSGWTVSALTADRGFERAFGRRADKRRRLYNGRRIEWRIYHLYRRICPMIGKAIFSRAPLLQNRLAPLPLGAIRPDGWLLEQMEAQVQKALELPEKWPGIGTGSAWLGGNGEAGRSRAMYLDGIVWLAYAWTTSR